MEKGGGVKDRDTPPCKNQGIKLYEKKGLRFSWPQTKLSIDISDECVDPEFVSHGVGERGWVSKTYLFCNFTIFMRSANDQCVNPLCKVSLYYM